MQNHVIVVPRHGGPEVLSWQASPVRAPDAGEVLLRQEAVGLNFIDTYFRSGLYARALPHGLGIEAAGVVESVGEGVTHLAPGDRAAYAYSEPGAYAQYRTLSAACVVKLPDQVSSEQAASLYMKGLTVQYLLRQTFPVQAGQTILLHAAAGGVGLILCQWAQHLGVRVIGTVSNPEKARLAKDNGAWEIIDYSREDVVQRVHELTGGQGVPVVYDGVGRDTWDISLQCLQTRGMLVNFGNASGPVTGVDLSLLQKKSLYVTRPGLGSHIDTRDKLERMSHDLFSMVASGVVDATVNQRYPLREAATAHRDLEARRTTGSAVLLPFS